MSSDSHHDVPVTVLHSGTVGPDSADPRARQVFHRLVDLTALGFLVTFVPVRTRVEGSAPGLLESAGVRLETGPREPARRRLDRALEGGGLVWLTDLALPLSLVELVVASTDAGRRLVVDLDRLPSSERAAARPALRDAEQDGLDHEIGELRHRERAVVDVATVCLADSSTTAEQLRELGAAAVAVIPPTAVRRSAPARARHDAVGATLVLPGRFTAEFATPDEEAVRRALACLADHADGTGLRSAVIAAEDAVPRQRTVARRWPAHLAGLAGSADAVRAAAVVLDGREIGLATTARRAELIAAGVPFVASPAAVGDDDLGDLHPRVVRDDTESRIARALELMTEPSARDEVLAGLEELAQSRAPARTREALTAALGPLAPEETASPVPPPGGPSEYRIAPVAGTLAACDRRVEQLEAEMVPLRLHSRETSIGLQSTMDADQRYRVFARTHLDAPPATAPPPAEPATPIRFSILVPCWNSDPALLEECIGSVVAQTHADWELCVVDDGSTEIAHLEVLERHAADDPRVHLRRNPWNQGIGLASNDALAMATGDWVVLLDHDDVLRPDALAWVAAYARACPDYDIFYSDEDKIDLEGRLSMPFFKPDWSPDLLLGVNYVCHLLAVRRELMEEVGGFRSGFDGAQDYDLVLRLTERRDRVGHISKVLYSWRMVPGSTSLDTGAKPRAHDAGHRALRDAMVRRFQPAVVTDGQAHTTHVVRYSVDTDQLLTVVVPTRDRVDLLRACVERLRRTSPGVRYEVLVVDNQSSDPHTLAYLDELAAAGHQVVRYPFEFSFARQVNLAAWHARGDLVLVLNNDALALTGDWLLRMMEHAQRPEVGMVGAKLMFPEGQRDGRPQHEGIVMGMAGLAYNIDLGGYMGMDQFVRDCSAVTAACVMMRPETLLAVSGMEERLRVAYNDVDLGLRVSEFGERVVYTPHAVLEHPESASRKDLHPMEDEDWLVHRWGPKGAVRDPFVSPHFEWLMPVFYRL